MNRRINADLIHLELLQQEQMLAKIEIAQIVSGRGAEEGQEDTRYGQTMIICQISAL
jgi:hypothetical protein